jgi:hypothetical protein
VSVVTIAAWISSRTAPLGFANAEAGAVKSGMIDDLDICGGAALASGAAWPPSLCLSFGSTSFITA